MAFPPPCVDTIGASNDDCLGHCIAVIDTSCRFALLTTETLKLDWNDIGFRVREGSFT